MQSVDISSDGKKFVSGSSGGKIHIWDAETLQQIGQPLMGHRGSVNSVAFSSNGKQIVSGSGDKTICIWNTETMQPVGQPLTGHSGQVTSVLFSSNRKQIFFGSSDNTICVWNAEEFLEIDNSIADDSLFNPHGYLSPRYKVSSDHWVLGINGEHIFWISPHLFNLIYHPFLLSIVNSSLHDFDCSHFVYGKQWEKCISNIM